MGHEPNNQREDERIVEPPTSKLKGCEDTNEDKEDPNEKLRKGSKPNLSQSRRCKKKSLKIVGGSWFAKQGNSTKSLLMFQMTNHITLQKQSSRARAQDLMPNEKPQKKALEPGPTYSNGKKMK